MSTTDGREHPIEAISAFVDGELRGFERESLEVHLDGCEACRALLEDLRRIARTVPAAAVTELPEDLEARVKARLRAEPVERHRRRFVLPVAVAATIGALALVTSLQFRQTRSLPETMPAPSKADDLGKTEREATELRAAPAAPAEPAQPTSVDEDAFAARQNVAAPRMRDQESASAPESTVKKQVAAKDSAADVPSNSASAPPPSPIPPPALMPPPPPPPPPAARDEDRLDRLEATVRSDQMAGQASNEADERQRTLEPSRVAAPTHDGKRAKVESSLEQKEVVGAVSGLAGGQGFVHDVSLHCPTSWRAPVDVVWDAAATADGLRALNELATEVEGQAVPGRDAQGGFVLLQVPMKAWPAVLERVRNLGATVPTPPLAPAGQSACVAIAVRTASIERP